MIYSLFLAGCQVLGIIDQDLDEDGDGYNTYKAPGGNDCNDHDPEIFPDAVEIPGDGYDQNCNGDNDEDADLDGYTIDQGDCNDLANWIRNDYFEYAGDGEDNDCDGVVDEINDLAAGTWKSWRGDSPGDLFGSTLAGGLVDTDANNDLLIGAPEAFIQEGFEGKVHGIRGKGTSVDYSIMGDAPYDRLGSSLAVGDYDGDGQGEVVAGSIGFDVDQGNANGAVGIFDPLNEGASAFSDAVVTWWGDDFSYAGRSLAFIGDVTEDGGEELLVGANGVNHAYLLSVSNGASQNGALSSVAEVILQGADENFGWSVAGGKDLNGDGLPDFIVGGYTNSTAALSAGAVYLYMDGINSSDPSVILTGEEEYGEAGYSVALVDDVDGSGYGAVLVGAPAQGARGDLSRGVAQLLPGSSDWTDRSLLDATRIYGQYENEFLGLSVASAGDVNSDGRGDFTLGGLSDEGGIEAGAVYLFLGGIRSYDGSEYGANNADAIFLGGEGMRAYVANGVGNTDGQAYEEGVLPYDDFAIGAPADGNQSGWAFLFFGQPTRQ